MKEFEWKDIKNLSFKERGLFRGDTSATCVICGKQTFIYDISFGCPLYPKCQVILDNDYMKTCGIE